MATLMSRSIYSDFKCVNFKHNLGIEILSIQVNITLEWMPVVLKKGIMSGELYREIATNSSGNYSIYLTIFFSFFFFQPCLNASDLLLTKAIPVLSCIQARHVTNKHYDRKWRAHRAAKFLKVWKIEYMNK